MNYRKDKYGNDLSVLGFGCMRFQQKLGRIDMEEAEREILPTVWQARPAGSLSISERCCYGLF